MKPILLGLVLAATGCMVGDDGTTGTGTGTSTGSGSGEGGGGNGGGGGGGNMDTLIDAGMSQMGSGPACTNAVYDPCNDNTQCTSGQCRLFNGSNIQVCTTTCTPGDNTTCPMQNGQPATCNNMGICKPPAANVCTR